MREYFYFGNDVFELFFFLGICRVIDYGEYGVVIFFIFVIEEY